jgi:transposase-like protein
VYRADKPEPRHPTCPHCGGTTYRLLKDPRAVECQDCGRSFSLDVGAQRQPPVEKLQQPE